MTAADGAGPRRGRCAPAHGVVFRAVTARPEQRPLLAAAERAQRLLGAGELLVASDFDGTLSHLVSDPWSARIIPAAQRALRRLAVTPDVHVALISGRTVLDLADRARVGGISYLGDHGAEWAEAPRGFRSTALRPIREPASDAEEAMAGELATVVPRIVPEPWLIVEWKGTALTFHFRAAPDTVSARSRVREAVDRVDPHGVLARSAGRRSLELRPADASHKGAALRRLIDERHPAAVLMLGDDDSDALAFDALRSARSDGHIQGLAIAVVGHADVGTRVAPRADLALPSPDDAASLLRLLASEAARFRSAPGRPLRPRSSRGAPR